eukprot:3399540-Lingulodinium_polyedra.AAC.1
MGHARGVWMDNANSMPECNNLADWYDLVWRPKYGHAPLASSWHGFEGTRREKCRHNCLKKDPERSSWAPW